VAVAASTLALVAGLGACQMASPITTDMAYDAADGVSVDLEDVVIRDLLVVSEGNGAPGTVSGLVVNEGTEEVTLTLRLGEENLAPEVTVAPGTSVRLDGTDPLTGEAGEAVTVPAIEGGPGSSLTLRFATSAGAGDSALVPVLAPTGQYSDMVGDQATATG
jgi:hypothetical protein